MIFIWIAILLLLGRSLAKLYNALDEDSSSETLAAVFLLISSLAAIYQLVYHVKN